MVTIILKKLFAAAFSSVGGWLVSGAAVLAVVGGIYFAGWHNRGVEERAKEDRASLNNLRNRNETNETVDKLPAPDLDRELGRWVLPE